jgi:hypothetical protein
VDWQIDPAGSAKDPAGRRVLPKGDKTRVIPVPTLSFTGYPIREALTARVAAALLEQQAGRNPGALLIPAERGGLLWHTSFNGDHLLPAMAAAGWPIEIRRETRDEWDAVHHRYTKRTVTRRKAALPWHSLRHRFARISVDVKQMREGGVLMAIGGWENIATVQTRYYRSGRDNMQAGLNYFD